MLVLLPQPEGFPASAVSVLMDRVNEAKRDSKDNLLSFSSGRDGGELRCDRTQDSDVFGLMYASRQECPLHHTRL